ncbi:single-strand binding protein [Kribbella flavida DSM 17836]|uniref:Single-stranded DNA-binding protein n=1 Tax=Kribbella flavida (strain DSM 17836 / JCM 10339 / NBRC 14399) TaxID=479435 RepID=D2PTH5_KRIFD|nr:single-stranded DNA-binding protein [Kribbella flavida]ADB31288.1 single-strand binding protein [Kribbella flavida DSM 17836]
MSGETYLTLQGRVGGDVQFKQVNGGHALASFRIGSTARTLDRAKGIWIDRPTTWFTVECWRTLAQNVADSVGRGDPVVVHGRLKTTEWTEDGEPRSRTVIEALSVGHDLTRGTTSFSKTPPSAAGSPPSSPDDEMRDLSHRAESSGEQSAADDPPFVAQEAA